MRVAVFLFEIDLVGTALGKNDITEIDITGVEIITFDGDKLTIVETVCTTLVLPSRVLEITIKVLPYVLCVNLGCDHDDPEQHIECQFHSFNFK